MICSEQLDRMAEADAFHPHHPVDDTAAHLTRAPAMPQVLLRRDDQRRRALVVERAQADEVCAVSLQLDAARLDQPLHRDLALDAIAQASADFNRLIGFFFFAFGTFDQTISILLLQLDVVIHHFSWIVVMLCGDAVPHLSDSRDGRIILHLLLLRVTQAA